MATVSVSDILVIADLHFADKLKSTALKFMIDNASEVMATEGWLKVSRTRLDLLNQVCQQLATKMDEMLQSQKKSSKRLKIFT